MTGNSSAATRLAIVLNGVVQNIVWGDPSQAQTQDGEIVAAAPGVQIGWTYDGSHFAALVITQDDLAAYARAVSWRVRTGGTTINGVHVQTDDASIALINGMVALAQQQPAMTFSFDTGSSIVSLTSAAAITLATAVGNFVQATFTKRGEVIAAITATPPTMTTFAQIDAAFAAISSAN